ncbi:hypothetical protein GPECTOR_19g350 [Gonium pectorale]|uniref:Glycosyl hydrolase family 32 N-terminal domain-containing protein n=1 Tax=Gonium pectorale TaxID=33097 RepID=A0A150GJB6_GONPE|nr:hypothetical protein GPECTOR_19g350 [Gonium pectorale]|eukprot:KXZ49899.1 hypothetical protein GPECTOR_19g350 [Gonium pectorale]
MDENGVPTILYTGVRLRSSDVCGPLPPPECDLGTACIETQCLAWADPDDPKLLHWTKEDVPFLSLPPPNMELTAWRDPFVIGRPGKDGQDCWTVMIGAGVKERGGTALVYRAESLRGGSWSYAGELCRGKGDTGVIWECPVLLQIPRLPAPQLAEPPAPAAKAASAAASPSPTKLQAAQWQPTKLAAVEAPRGADAGALGAAARGYEPTAQSQRVEPLPFLVPTPASPRPPIIVLPGGAGSTADAVDAAWAAAIAGGGGGDSGRMAVLSPRRTPPGPPSSRIMSPLPASPFSPTFAGHLNPRRTPPPSPRQSLTLHMGAAGPTLTRGSPTTPVSPRSPVSAVTTLLERVPTSDVAPILPAPLSPPGRRTPATAVEPGATAPPPAAARATSGDWRRYQTLFCLCPDDCNSMAVYYLGSYDPRVASFDLDSALGPFPLDLGDIFYAPNTLTDPEGRCVLWGWLQEKPRRVGAYDYAGCLSMPRLLYLEVDESDRPGSTAPAVHLVQRPPPGVSKLRVPGSEWLAEGLLLEPGSTLPVPLMSGCHIELDVTMNRTQPALKGLGVGADGEGGSRCSGVLLHSWRGGAEGAAALLYHWDSGVLEVVFEAMDPSNLTFSLAAQGARRVGGRLLRPPAPGSPLSLRVFLDYSCLEVFTAAGEVLTARVYRGAAPAAPVAHHPIHPSTAAHMTASPSLPLYGYGGAAAAGVELVSFGCSTAFESVAAYEVGSMWVEDL